MSRRALRQWREWRDRNFPERQIIFRSRGDVRYVSLSGRSQLLLGTCLLAFAGWLGYASVNAIYRDKLLESRDRRIAELTLAYERLAQDFERNQENFLVASRDLEERYQKLHDMAQKQGLTQAERSADAGKGTKPAAQPVQTAKAPDPKPEQKPEPKAAEASLPEIKVALAPATPAAAPVPAAPAVAPAAAPAPAAPNNAVALAAAALPAAPPPAQAPAQQAPAQVAAPAGNTGIRTVSAPANTAPAASTAAPAATASVNNTGNSAANGATGDARSIEDLEAMLRASRQKPQAGVVPKAGEIEARILALRGRQRDVVDDLNHRTDKNVTSLESALRGTGLDLDGMLKRYAAARADVGIGGPLRTVADAAGAIPAVGGVKSDGQMKEPLDRDVMRLEGKLGRWGELVALAQRLPLSLPADPDETELSSPFGRRMDPFTKQWAFHAGLDLIGPRQATILSTAPGVVVFAGRKGPYGRAVEIDHGLGVKTRYAHLSSIAVQVGDTVPFNKKIGAMGSTGRSTGQHLHYEILLDDEPVDPSKFIEAGYHVFKQQEDSSSGR